MYRKGDKVRVLNAKCIDGICCLVNPHSEVYEVHAVLSNGVALDTEHKMDCIFPFEHVELAEPRIKRSLPSWF